MTEFFEVINNSATHIYDSALALTPKSSIVRKLYHRFVRPAPRVVVGLPCSWDPRIASVVLPTQYPDMTWSPCSRFVAVTTTTGIEFRDSTTLEKLSALESPASLSLSAVTISYSPNGRLLACACTWSSSFELGIAIWDIQTGGIVKAIHGGEPGYPRSMLYSSDGKMLAVACGKSPYKWTASIFDTASGERACSDELESELDPVFWTEKNSIRFATSHRDCDGLSIDTWEITSTSGGHPTKVDSFRVRHEFHSDNHQITFSPASLRVAVVSVNSTIIRDVRDSSPLLETSASRALGGYAGHFSPDGNFFACTEQQDLQIWKAFAEGYSLWAKFPLRFPAAAGGTFAFSPDSGSIIGWGSGITEVWKVDQVVNPPASERPYDVWNNHLVSFSTNGAYVAIGRASLGVITVVDLRSGVPELIINLDMGIMDIKMIDDTVFALGDERVVSWNLTGGSYDQDRGVRLAGLDQSLEIVVMAHDYSVDQRLLDPMLLDHQCRNALYSSADEILIFNAGDGTRLMDYHSPVRFRAFRFSPDGGYLWITFIREKGYDDDCDEDDESEAGNDGGSVENGSESAESGGESVESGGESAECEDASVEGEDASAEGEDVSAEGEDGSELEGSNGGDAPGNSRRVEEESEEGFELAEDEETGQITLVPLPEDSRPPVHPWKSTKGYEIDGLAIQWVLGPDGKKLLWLPPHWRTTNEKTRRWNGDFLVLRESTLPETAIIQLSAGSGLVSL